MLRLLNVRLKERNGSGKLPAVGITIFVSDVGMAQLSQIFLSWSSVAL